MHALQRLALHDNSPQSSVDDVMVRSCLCTIRPEASITNAANKLYQQRSTALVVLDGTPLGMITVEQVIHSLADLKNPETTQVRDVMSPAPILAVNRGSSLSHVFKVMLEHEVYAVAVRDGEKLAGLVTLPVVLPFLAVRTEQQAPLEAI